MRDQACKYGAKVETEFVTKLEREEQGLFTATWGSGCRTARTVLLATGVTNRRPPMDEQLHDEALSRGLVRYCPICDGYEVTDKKVGVIGSDSHGVAEALFLRGYTADLTLITPDKALQPAAVRQAAFVGIVREQVHPRVTRAGQQRGRDGSDLLASASIRAFVIGVADPRDQPSFLCRPSHGKQHTFVYGESKLFL